MEWDFRIDSIRPESHFIFLYAHHLRIAKQTALNGSLVDRAA
jgi:hypothetical protein